VSTLLGICGATALVTSRDLLTTLQPLGAHAPQLRSFVTVDDVTPDNELPTLPRQWLDDPERITILQHSSGSTGLQKGIALSSRAVINQIETYAPALRVQPTDRIANWMPLYHDGGLIAGFVQPLVQGLELSILSPMDWVRDPVLLLRAITADRGILLILDEIQAGVGRTGAFFAFEESGIVPDIVTISKSISGSGLPMSLVLLRPEVDVWKPGQHTGTFRGNNLAFVSARVALETYWADAAFTDAIAAKSRMLRAELEAIAADHPAQAFVVRGRGLMYGLACDGDRTLAGRISKEAFTRGLVIETSGAHDEVLKFLPALTITDDELARGLQIVSDSLDAVL